MVKSPCIDVCRFEGRTGFCFGCLRTLEEARTWDRLTDHKRHAILNERSRREAKLDSRIQTARTQSGG
jgi:uncharacterized protein